MIGDLELPRGEPQPLNSAATTQLNSDGLSCPGRCNEYIVQDYGEYIIQDLAPGGRRANTRCRNVIQSCDWGSGTAKRRILVASESSTGAVLRRIHHSGSDIFVESEGGVERQRPAALWQRPGNWPAGSPLTCSPGGLHLQMVAA